MNRAVGGHWLAWEETAGTRCRGSCLRVPASGAALSITALVAGVESISNDGHRTEQVNNGGWSFRTGTWPSRVTSLHGSDVCGLAELNGAAGGAECRGQRAPRSVARLCGTEA
jgi:hypothetical protein